MYGTVADYRFILLYIFNRLGDVHGGGEGFQHRAGHGHAADQTEGDC